MSDPLLAGIKRLQCPFPPGAVIVTYSRDSGGEEQDRSVDQQLATFEAYAKQFHLTIHAHFPDRARSGGSDVGREQFHRMMALLREHAPEPSRRRQTPTPNSHPPIAGLLIWNHRRFGRNLNDSQFYKADLRRRGYLIASITDHIPDADGIGALLEVALDWHGQKQREEISQDVKRGLMDLVTKRKPDGSYEGFMPGRPPTCFTREAVTIGVNPRTNKPRVVGRWAPDPATWERGQQAWAMRAAGHSIASVHKATHLFRNENGYTTFFRNEIYRGVLVFSGQRLLNFVAALCTEEQWGSVNSNRKPRPRKGETFKTKHPRQVNSKYLLSGLFTCGQCGAHLVGGRDTHGWRYYICAVKEKDKSACNLKRLSADVMEHTVIEYLCSHLLTDDHLTRLHHQSESEQAAQRIDAAKQINALKRKLAETKRAIKRLLDLTEKGRAPASVAERLAEREREKSDLETRIARAGKAANRSRPLSAEQMAAFSAALRAKLHSGDPQQVKPLLNAIVVELVAYADHGRLRYILPWPPTDGPAPGNKKPPEGGSPEYTGYEVCPHGEDTHSQCIEILWLK